MFARHRRLWPQRHASACASTSVRPRTCSDARRARLEGPPRSPEQPDRADTMPATPSAPKSYTRHAGMTSRRPARSRSARADAFSKWCRPEDIPLLSAPWARASSLRLPGFRLRVYRRRSSPLRAFFQRFARLRVRGCTPFELLAPCSARHAHLFAEDAYRLAASMLRSGPRSARSAERLRDRRTSASTAIIIAPSCCTNRLAVGARLVSLSGTGVILSLRTDRAASRSAPAAGVSKRYAR